MNDRVASCNILWVRNLKKKTESAAKRKPTEMQPTVRVLEHIEGLRQTCRKPLTIRKQKCPFFKNVWSHVRWMLNKELDSRPYKMVMAQAFKDQHTVNWETFCENRLNAQGTDTVNRVLMTDEANFNLSSCANSHYWRYWATEKTRDVRQERLHSENVLFGIV
jgi:hypothetical protein